MAHARVLTAEDLGLAVREARRARGWRQVELAEVLGVKRMTISRLERGAPVSAATAIRALAECGAELLVGPKFAEPTPRGN